MRSAQRDVATPRRASRVEEDSAAREKTKRLERQVRLVMPRCCQVLDSPVEPSMGRRTHSHAYIYNIYNSHMRTHTRSHSRYTRTHRSDPISLTHALHIFILCTSSPQMDRLQEQKDAAEKREDAAQQELRRLGREVRAATLKTTQLESELASLQTAYDGLRSVVSCVLVILGGLDLLYVSQSLV